MWHPLLDGFTAPMSINAPLGDSPHNSALLHKHFHSIHAGMLLQNGKILRYYEPKGKLKIPSSLTHTAMLMKAESID